MTTPRPVFLSSLFSAFKRIGRPFTVTEQNGELRKSLQVKLTAATVGVVSKFVMERALGVLWRVSTTCFRSANSCGRSTSSYGDSCFGNPMFVSNEAYTNMHLS